MYPVPVLTSIVGSRGATATSPFTVTLPTGYVKGDLCFIIGADQSGLDSWSATGWTALFNTRAHILYRVMDGSEGSTVSVTRANSSNTVAVSCFVVRRSLTSTAPECSANANGTSVSPDALALNPTNWDVEDTLWLYIIRLSYSSAGAGGSTITAWPSGWYPGHDYESVSGTPASNDCSIHWTYQFNRTASVDPAAATISPSTQWCALTVGIRPDKSNPVFFWSP